MQRFFVLFRRNLATVFTMKRRVTIGADGNQVIDGIHHICFADLIQRNNVMHLNDILKFRTVSLFKNSSRKFYRYNHGKQGKLRELGDCVHTWW